MEKAEKAPSAEELLRRIQELEVRCTHIKQQISKLMQPKPSDCSHLRAIGGPSVAPDDGGVMDPLAMKLTETQYLNIMESMGQAVHVFDRKYRIHLWNRTAEEIYGYTPAEVFGKTPTEILVDPKDAMLADYLLERTVNGECWSGEFPVTNKRGETFVVIATNAPLRDENGRLIGGSCISSDSRSYQLMKPKIGPMRNDSLQLRQTSIASKISNLASKVKLKMRTHNEGGSADHSDDSTPRGHIDPSPFGVFLSTSTEERLTGKFTIRNVDKGQNKDGISNILSSKAEEWVAKKRSLWPWKGNERKDDSLVSKLGQFGWQRLNLNQEPEPGLLLSASSGYSTSSSNSGSTSIKSSNAIIKVEKERDSLDYDILWEDLITKQQIGQGSCGTVYHGLWDGSDVAIKLFTYQDYSEDVLISFKQEVSLMKQLRHPNILLFMGAVTSPQRLCIVTEFLPRGSLFRILNQKSSELDWRRRLHMAMDIARGMNYLHHHYPPIVHRDLKSSNLLVAKNWTVKVGDFGLSRIKHQAYLKTKSGNGTPQWMAPEILRNEQADEMSDVYSYRVVLWEIVTGKIPWDDLHPMQVIGAVGFMNQKRHKIDPRLLMVIGAVGFMNQKRHKIDPRLLMVIGVAGFMNQKRHKIDPRLLMVIGAVGFMNQRLEIPKDMDQLWVSLIESCWCSEPQSRPTFQEILYKLKELQKKFAIERRR